MRLAPRSNAFYGKLKQIFAADGAKPLEEARILDFGCGWGRMTRFFARDVAPGRLFGCDASSESLALCSKLRVPARLEQNDPMPTELPFDTGIDLVFSHSVFTHLSEPAHEACLRAIHDVLEPGGRAVLTVRPPSYMDKPPMAWAKAQLGEGAEVELDQPSYYFTPGSKKNVRMSSEKTSTSAVPDGKPTFGNTFITHAYMREHWTPMFEIVDVRFLLESMTQVVVTLRRPPTESSPRP